MRFETAVLSLSVSNAQIEKRWIKDECFILDEIVISNGALYERSIGENKTKRFIYTRSSLE